jgi:acyl-homoserine-lactone acylase
MHPRLLIPVIFLSLPSLLTAGCSEEDGSAPSTDGVGVEIYRDEWGVPHIYGPSDASVVFGAAYAQAEDNWWQVEDNFVRAIGRGAELYGEEALLDDYLVRGLEILRRSMEEYEGAPEELRSLYDAFAAGFNHFLETHPEVERRVLEKVEPWHTLALIRFKYHHNEFLGYAGLERRQSLRALERSWSNAPAERMAGLAGPGADLPSLAWPEGVLSPDGERTVGSNEWAVSGSRTASGHPMLLINPHVSFFGLSTYWEVHLESEEGLVFSGQTRFGFMLPYMGNNRQLGWAYTDNYGDHGDLYVEELGPDSATYRYDGTWRDLTTWSETIQVRSPDGMDPREFRFLKTHHGPILGITEEGRPLAVRLAKYDEGGWFEQWYGMMRAGSLEEWRASVALLNVSYMNTMYTDRDGNILYLYTHAIPRRSPDYDWSRPVPGNDPGTEWQGYHTLDELPQFLNPEAGYLQNTNSDPFVATDGIQASAEDFPPYMVGSEPDNRRAQSSRRILRGLRNLTLEAFAKAVLDTRLTAADEWLDALFQAFDVMKRDDPQGAAVLDGPMASLRDWDRVSTTASVPTTLFVLWSEAVNPDRTRSPDQWLDGLARVVRRLEEDWGTWEVPWGEINRIQRPDASGQVPFDDALPSLPVAGAPGTLGSVFTFHSRPAENGRRRYGEHGNSFVKVVEFTPTIQARSVFVFGQSGDPESPHYFDQAGVYSASTFKPAWFTREEVEAHAERLYEVTFPG